MPFGKGLLQKVLGIALTWRSVEEPLRRRGHRFLVEVQAMKRSRIRRHTPSLDGAAFPQEAQPQPPCLCQWAAAPQPSIELARGSAGPIMLTQPAESLGR